MSKQTHELSSRSVPSQPLTDWLAQEYDSLTTMPAGQHGPSLDAAVFGTAWAAAWDHLGLKTADQRQAPATPDPDSC